MNNLAQLESARTLALGEGRYYATILPGVIPILTSANTNEDTDIQRWGAEFIAETFASPAWPSHEKEPVSLTVLPVLMDMMESHDTGVVKSAVQAAASIYPLVYRHIISAPHDSHNWKIMLAIKSNILRRMDTAPPGVRICCVKFLQVVVLVQTPGMVADPRRPEQNDISLALVPREHPLLPYANLEAEASGLLDRLLGIINGDHSNALLITATLNTLGTLIQRRPIIAPKIVHNLLQFNALKLANSPMTPTNKVILKSIERTTRALFVNILKRNPEGPHNAKIQQYLERMHRTRLDIFDESRKRPAPVEPTDGLDPAKRQRLVAEAQVVVPVTVPAPSTAPSAPLPVPPPLPPGPVSYLQLYTLDPNNSGAIFDVQAFQDPAHLLRMVMVLLNSIDEAKLNNALNAVRSRYLQLSKDASRTQGAIPGNIPVPVPNTVDDEDEYEPDFEPEDAEQVSNRLDGAPPLNSMVTRVPDAPLAPYKLPEAPPLSENEAQRYGGLTIRRMFGVMGASDDTSSKGMVTKSGFNRLAATNYDRDAWLTILCRLATRASGGLDDYEQDIKSEFQGDMPKKGSLSLGDTIRENLYNYIMYDWRKRIDVAINWLTEEWYNDRIQVDASRKRAKATMNGHAASVPDPKGHYHRCVLRVLDGILPFIEGNDKGLLRLMSEIPEIDKSILSRMKKMAEDPERIDLAIMVLQYLYMFKPPAREICVDILEDIWRTNDRAKPSAKKFLAKWRPQVLEIESEVKMESVAANGALEVQPA